jgi:hypothetical protein
MMARPFSAHPVLTRHMRAAQRPAILQGSDLQRFHTKYALPQGAGLKDGIPKENTGESRAVWDSFVVFPLSLPLCVST